MASSNRVLWEKDIRESIRTNFGAGWRVNGEQSGKTKILYVYQEGLGKSNKRTSVTLPIEWKKRIWKRYNIRSFTSFMWREGSLRNS